MTHEITTNEDSMTHPLEELAKWHDIQAASQDDLAISSNDSPLAESTHAIRAMTHRAFAALLRRSIPDCECGELVRRELAMDGPYRSISFTRRNGGTVAEHVLIYGTDAKRIPFIEEPTKTLPAAVAAARTNGAEGTTNAE